MDNLKTEHRIKREAQEKIIVDDFNKCLDQPGAMKGPVTTAICGKYEIKSEATLWYMRKRVAEREATNQNTNQ